MEPDVLGPATAAPAKKRSSVVWIIVIAVVVFLLVPCIGITAAVAIPAFVGYVRRSKVSEATSELRRLRSLVLDSCAHERVDRATGTVTSGGLPGAAGPVPAHPGPQKQIPAHDPVFDAIGFTFSDPVYYGYSIVPSGSDSVVLRATGDLDGDGVESVFEIRCQRSGNECTCDPSPTITNELE